MLPDAYACIVANRFGNLLDDDADPFDLISDAEAEKDKKKKRDEQKKKKEEQRKSQQKKPGGRESQKERRVPFLDGQDAVTGFNRPTRGGSVLTGGRGGALDAERGPRRAGFRDNRINQDEQPLEFSIPKPPFNADFDPRGRGGVRGGRRGGGRYFGNSDINPRGKTKREYERQSGTGISPEEKRGGRGPWNWGPAQDTVGEGMEVEPDAAAVKPEDSQPPLEGEEPIPEADGEVEVQVAMEMGFDEWKSLQEMNRPKVEFNLRKPESKVPSKARVIHQSKKPEKPKFDATEDMEGDGHFLRKPVNDITSRLDINFGSLGRPTRGGRGRGGRGGATTRPEKISVTKTKQVEGPAPNPDDPEDFPALTAGK